MLSSTRLFDTPALRVSDVSCAHARGPWAGVETATGAGIIFARRGTFRRRGRHGEQVVEPGVAVLQQGGEEEEFAHPRDGGDDCTAILVGDALLAALLGGEPGLPAGVVATGARDDLTHRSIVAGARRGAAPEALEERTVALLASVLGHAAPARVASGRPATARARRALASDAREALAADVSLGLVELAREVGASPHHLSRVFGSEVGVPVSLYRRRLRLRAALERLGGGESDLARVAADAGFADHAHLAREARALVGLTPSALRGELRDAWRQGAVLRRSGYEAHA
jgi:AraC-like DNA-binding protein